MDTTTPTAAPESLRSDVAWQLEDVLDEMELAANNMDSMCIDLYGKVCEYGDDMRKARAAVSELIEAKDAYIREADRRISVLASLLNQSNVDRLREVERAVANERVRDVHTCHDQCTKTELCRMTRRAEAAENAMPERSEA